ncbi:MAG: LysM peptidoglycan-binding domain-containing protein [Chloroflexi bacterium]|nr:LysM peptidoglycan-binding domain-containing protein [Chloroflexota bacterium]
MKRSYLALFSALFVLVVAAAVRPSSQAAAQQTNLLTNPGFEGGHYNQDGISEITVPNGWRMHWLDGQPFAGSNGNAARPETVVWNIKDAPLNEQTLFFRDGSYALKIFKGWAPLYAGLSQDVSGLEVGRRYRLAIPIFIDIVESYEGGKQAPGKLDSGQVRIGTSAVGAGWRNESAIQYSGWWTAGNIQPFYQAYPVFLHDFTATSPNMTIWIEMASKDPYINNGFFMDGLAMLALDERDNSVTAPPASGGTTSGSAAVAQPAGPTATPPPTPTPRADGAVVHTVQSGDSFWGLAIQYAGVMGLSAEAAVKAIQDLNNNPTFINPGDELIIVPPNQTPPTPTPEPVEEEPTAEAEAAEATAEPEETAVTSDTALNTVSNANTANGICVTAFEDANSDGQRDLDAEPLMSNVAISVFQGGKNVASYVTDGVNPLYCFENLNNETYQVQAYPPAGYQTTTPESWAVAVTDGVIIPVSFGLTTAPPTTADAIADASLTTSEATAVPAAADTTNAAAEQSGGFLANMSGIILIIAAFLVLLAGAGVYLLRRG